MVERSEWRVFLGGMMFKTDSANLSLRAFWAVWVGLNARDLAWRWVVGFLAVVVALWGADVVRLCKDFCIVVGKEVVPCYVWDLGLGCCWTVGDGGGDGMG